MTLDMTKRIDAIERAVRACRKRLASIDDSKKHYLRVRHKKRMKMFERGKALITRLEKLEKALGGLRLGIEKPNGTRRYTLMFTPYERIKLRRLLESDDRLAFHCSSEDADVLRSLIESHKASDKKLGGT